MNPGAIASARMPGSAHSSTMRRVSWDDRAALALLDQRAGRPPGEDVRLELGESGAVEIGREHRGDGRPEPGGEPATDASSGSGRDRHPALEREEHRRRRGRLDRLGVEGRGHCETSTLA